MKYGITGGFIRFAFAKTAFGYIEKEIPEIDLPSYKKRVLKEYRAIVKRTPGIGSVKDNMFVVTMYAGAFLIALLLSVFMLISSGLWDTMMQKMQGTDLSDPAAVETVRQELLDEILKRYGVRY